MFRHEYPAALEQCNFTMSQTNALLALIEDGFPAGRDMITGGWVDGMNSMCRFLYGDMLAHDEFEDDHPCKSDESLSPGNGYLEIKDTCTSLMAKSSSNVIHFQPIALQIAKGIRAELNSNQVDTFIKSMLSLAAPPMNNFIASSEVGDDIPSDGYFLAKAAWWVYFFESWSNI